MGNITDIPPYLLVPDSQDDFFVFLLNIPLTFRRKLQLYIEWSELTGLELTDIQLQTLGIKHVLLYS